MDKDNASEFDNDSVELFLNAGSSRYRDQEEISRKATQQDPVAGTEHFVYNDISPGMLYSHALESVRECGFVWVGNTRRYDQLRETRISENWLWSPLGILSVVRGTPQGDFINMGVFFNIIPTVPAVFNELDISGHYEKPLGHSTGQDIFIGDVLLTSNLRLTIKTLQDNGTILNGQWQSLPLTLRYALGHEFLSEEELKIFGEREDSTPNAVQYINRKILEAIGVEYERRR